LRHLHPGLLAHVVGGPVDPKAGRCRNQHSGGPSRADLQDLRVVGVGLSIVRFET
jgi:hypothetical protein